MSGHGEKNFTRSLRDEIKAKQEELKNLKAKAKEDRASKKATTDATKAGRFRLSVQTRFLLEEAPAQVETATQIFDGLFAKRELTETFKAYFDLKVEERAKKVAQLKSKKAAEEAEEAPAAG